MPIPAIPAVLESGAWKQKVAVPVPERWQNTYVSITGSDGEGEEIPLTGFQSGAWPTIVLQPGVTGLDMPPFEMHADDSPNLDGSTFRGVRAVSRPLLLPVFVYGIDRRTLRDFKRKLAAALNPKNGPAILTFVEQDGVPRRLRCFYSGGMEGSESADSAGFRWIAYGLQLTALDPWWYGDTEVAADWSFGSQQAFLGPSFFPVNLGHGQRSTGDLLIDNVGDIEAWPVWEITGPLKSFTFTGPDGSSWGVPAQAGNPDVLPSGRTLIVDSRPGFKTIKDDQGVNYFPLLSPNPSFWSVPSGISTAHADLVAGSGTPTVSMKLLPRYTTY